VTTRSVDAQPHGHRGFALSDPFLGTTDNIDVRCCGSDRLLFKTAIVALVRSLSVSD
jgi:hypothetical protein